MYNSFILHKTLIQMKKSKNLLSFIAISIIALTFTSLIFKFPQENIFAYDNYGYYLYLPSKFIQKDLTFSDTSAYKKLNETYKNTPTYYQLMPSPKGGTIIRMYMGIAILISPAFFTGHIFALLTNFPPDGYSAPYQWTVIVYGLLLTLIGLITARKMLLKYFNDSTTALTLFITYFGTILLFFATLGNPIPHVYLFNLYIFLIWFTINWHEKQKWGSAVGIGVILGLIIAIRPSEIIALIIPVFYGIYNLNSLKIKINLVQKNLLQILTISIIFLVIIFPQYLYWRHYAGEYFVSVYNDPGSTMDWLKPRIFNVLFSFRKGWFIYSPLSILAVTGMIFLYKSRKNEFLFTILFFIFNLYIISCFTSLISYGYRAFVQSLAVMMFPLATLMGIIIRKRTLTLTVFTTLIVVFIYINFVQTKQLRMEIIDKSRMTRRAFLAVLGKWDAKKPEMYMSVARTGYGIDTLKQIELYNEKQLIFNTFEDTNSEYAQKLDSAIFYSGKHSLKTDSTYSFSPGIKETVSNHVYTDHFWIRASVYFYSDDPESVKNANLVVTVQKNDNPFKYRGINFQKQNIPFQPGKWQRIIFDYISPENMPEDAELKVYFWNSGTSDIWIDDLNVSMFIPKEELY